jgi:hypothetical protein
MYGIAPRFNPLKNDALTASLVEAGDKIICWQPHKPETTRHLTIVSGPSHDDDGTLVVVVRDKYTGEESTEQTDTVGLTGNRSSGEWTVIAIPDDEFDD